MDFQIEGRKKYGLQVKKPISAFQPDEEESVSQQIAKQAALNRARATADAAKVLSVNPLAYAYDSARVDAHKDEDRSVRYHPQVKAKVEQRKREQSILQERSERKKLEGTEDEERYITQSYLQLMQANQALEEQLDREDRLKDTRTAKDSAVFYANLLKNKAMGRIQDSDPVPLKKLKTTDSPMDSPKESPEDSPEQSLTPQRPLQEAQSAAPISTSEETPSSVHEPAGSLEPPEVFQQTKAEKLAAARARYLERKSGH
jgi:hypothetical protein